VRRFLFHRFRNRKIRLKKLCPRDVRDFVLCDSSDRGRSSLQTARAVISSKQADVVLFVWPGFDDAMQRHDRGQVSVYYDSVIPQSAQAWSHLSGLLGRFREHLRQQRQRERGLPAGFVRALDVREGDVAPFQRQISNVLGQILPIMLLMLSIVGPLVAAVDMTAGEKDRATMHTLVCAPIRSLEIVQVNVDRGRSNLALQPIPVPLNVHCRERRQVFTGFRPQKGQKLPDNLLIANKRSRRGLLGGNPALKMLTDGSSFNWCAERLHYVGNHLTDHFVRPLWRQPSRPSLVLDLLNFMANPPSFLFVRGERRFASTPTP
jgi:hypothetical protein